MNNTEELIIGEKTWRNTVQPIEKDGYREGHENGRQESFQNGFDQGYKEGFETAYRMSYQNAAISVIQKYALLSNVNEGLNMIPFETPWKGNCDICKTQNKS